MRRQHAVVASCLVGALSSCAAAPKAAIASAEPGEPRELGEVVHELGTHLWIVFQDTHATHWFGSDGEGVYRVDGKRIVRYTTKDGLCSDQIRQIEEDASGNLCFNTLGGISRFDGHRFETLVPIVSATSASEWKSEPGDLWFKGNQDQNGPYRFDGKSLFALEFPKHELEDAFHAKFPNVPYSPYGIYTIVKDRRGSIWFGSANFGACRYDGKSFLWISEPELTELDDGPSFGVRGILEDQDGKFWFNETLNRYDAYPTDRAKQGTTAPKYRKEPGLVDSRAQGESDHVYFTSALRDKQGVSWMATYGGRVSRYDGKQLTHFPVQEGGKAVLLFSIYEDRRGVLWLGTTESGAYRFNGKGFERFRP